jgi:hypothetical protein
MLQSTKLQLEFWTVVYERKFLPTAPFLLQLPVGDYRKPGPAYTLEEIKNAANIFKKSPVPVFPLIGDNDSVDCPNFEEGQKFWMDTFDNFACSPDSGIPAGAVKIKFCDPFRRFSDFWSDHTWWLYR